jgi:hypothetical protein
MDSKDLIMIFKSRKNDERRTEENEAFLKLVIHSSSWSCFVLPIVCSENKQRDMGFPFFIFICVVVVGWLLCLIACHFGLSEFALHLLNCVCIDWSICKADEICEFEQRLICRQKGTRVELQFWVNMGTMFFFWYGGGVVG